MLYVDTSAAAKLLVTEVETAALRGFLRAAAAPLVTSRVGVVELRRIGRRTGRPDRADAVAATLHVVELTDDVERIAVGLDASLRALDAIHLATALAVGERLTGFVCYDTRLADAARAAGVAVLAPA